MGRGALVSRAAAALAAFAVAGCASGTYRLDRGIDRGGVSPASTARHDALVLEGDRLWAGRADPARVAAAIARWEAAVAIKDDDWTTYTRLAQAYFFQADSVFAVQAAAGRYPYHGGASVDARAARRYREAHRRGLTFALRGMAARSPEFEQRLQAGIDMDRAVRVMGKEAAPLVYWYAANLARWARSSGVRALIRSRSAIVSALHHLHRIDPGYFWAGADRLLGAYYAAAPGVMGGDLARSRVHFEAALRAAPAYLGTAVLAAEFLDRKARDRASFEKRLRAVIAQPDATPEVAPENSVERRKARALLQQVDTVFRP
jgi:hypothetical protein